MLKWGFGKIREIWGRRMQRKDVPMHRETGSKDSSGRWVISTFLSGITAVECNGFDNRNHWQAASATLQCYPKCSALTGHHWPGTGYCQCLGRRELFVRGWHYLVWLPFLFLCSKTLLMKEAVQLHSSLKTSTLSSAALQAFFGLYQWFSAFHLASRNSCTLTRPPGSNQQRVTVSVMQQPSKS